jgi:hypothetical protein
MLGMVVVESTFVRDGLISSEKIKVATPTSTITKEVSGSKHWSHLDLKKHSREDDDSQYLISLIISIACLH